MRSSNAALEKARREMRSVHPRNNGAILSAGTEAFIVTIVRIGNSDTACYHVFSNRQGCTDRYVCSLSPRESSVGPLIRTQSDSPG